MLLSTSGKTMASTRTGLYSMKSLHVADGGIVRSLPEVAAQLLEFDIGDLHIYGGGIMNSIWMGISASNLTVDHLGHLYGDSFDDKYVVELETFCNFSY